MQSMATLKRQHQEISEILAEIKKDLDKGGLDKEATKMATKISILAGKLKIHLNTEDKYMYPQLLQSGNEEMKKIAQSFIKEMGDISREFVSFKDRFNTRIKITGDPQGFIRESDRIFEVLKERIAKEDSSLYTII